MKLWPQSKVAQRVMIGLGVLLVFDALAITYFVTGAFNHWHRAPYDASDFENQYADKESLVFFKSLMGSGDTTKQDKLIDAEMAFLSAKREHHKGHAAVATQGYDEAYDLAVAAGGANCELALWILDVHGQSDFYDQSYKTAQKYFKQLLSTASDNEQNKEIRLHATVWLARCLQAQTLYDRAITEYLQAQKLAEDLDKGQKESPHVAYVSQKLGQCYGDCAQYSKAIDTLEQVKKILREHNAPAKVQAYNIACLAYCKIKDNRATEALSDLNVCLQIAKDNQDLLKQRAYAYLKLKNYDASLSDYGKLIKLDPANPQLFVERAEANEAKANFDDALSDIEQAIELKPLSFDYRMTRARILVESQKDKLALQAFSELINDYPDYIDLLIRRAQFYNYKKDYAHAIADYTSYIDKAQSKPKAGNETDTGNTPTASANLVQKSYLADVYLERATAYEHQGQKSEAANDRKKAAQLKAPAKAAN
ncbi:MAG: hypothetical protein IPP97_28060 [Candidatus Obscuribacter sp.]|nr:hypothetical protein [Candidatus Obscuribacter sp.]MBP6351153.1 hypothetical protein [Candidatus Obscuribacter sp.]